MAESKVKINSIIKEEECERVVTKHHVKLLREVPFFLKKKKGYDQVTYMFPPRRL